jgi:hypothetical protein
MDGIVLLLILGVVYFIPSAVAKGRNHSKFEAILALNIFLGWTFIGWVAALVWALTEDNPTRREIARAMAEVERRRAAAIQTADEAKHGITATSPTETPTNSSTRWPGS